MNRIFYYILCLSALILVSCSDMNDLYFDNQDEQLLALGIVRATESDNFMIYMDNKDILYPTQNDVPNFEFRDSQRVSVNYSILYINESVNNGFDIKINNIAEVLFKDVVMNTDNLASSENYTKNDPLLISDIWIVRDFLNISYQFYGGEEQHFVNVVFQSFFETEKEPIALLDFTHNAQNDKANILHQGIASFNLKQLRQAGSDHTNIQLKANILYEGLKEFDLVYTY